MIKVLSFASGFTIGLIALYELQETVINQLIFIFFLLSFDFIRELSIHMIEGFHKKETLSEKVHKIFYSLSPIYGFAFAYLVDMNLIVKTSVLALFAGAIIYVLVKEVVVTREEKIQPPYFISGALVMAAIFLVNNGI